jgi:cyclase
MATWKLILLLALFLPPIAYAEAENKQFDINKRSDSTYILIGKGYGTNVGIIVGDKGLLLIDPMPGEEFLDGLDLLIKTILNKPVSYVVNTHNHEDHTGGNVYFNNNGATVLTQNNVLIKTDSDNSKSLLSKNYGLEVINVKSHTNQDKLYFHSESNVLFVGDVFENNWHPTFYAGGIDGFTKAIETILAVGDQNTLIVPGHGASSTKEVVKAFYENTLAWLKRVSVLYKEKMSVEQIMGDKQINEILQRFNTEHKKVFIPQEAFKRFIERTISIVSSN